MSKIRIGSSIQFLRSAGTRLEFLLEEYVCISFCLQLQEIKARVSRKPGIFGTNAQKPWLQFFTATGPWRLGCPEGIFRGLSYFLVPGFILELTGINDGAKCCFCVGAWRSLGAHLNGVQGVGGSNPLAPTKNHKEIKTKAGWPTGSPAFFCFQAAKGRRIRRIARPLKRNNTLSASGQIRESEIFQVVSSRPMRKRANGRIFCLTLAISNASI